MKVYRFKLGDTLVTVARMPGRGNTAAEGVQCSASNTKVSISHRGPY